MIFGISDTGANDIDVGDFTNSLRFRANVQQYMQKPGRANAAPHQKGVVSMWVKRSTFGGIQQMACSFADTNSRFIFFFEADGRIGAYGSYQGSQVYYKLSATNVTFLDTAAWYHVELYVDTTDPVAEDRVKIYVNGNRIISWSVNNPPALNAYGWILDPTWLQRIGIATVDGQYLDAYVARACFMDGVTVTPGQFGKLNPETGQWITRTRSEVKALVDTGGPNSYMYEFNDGTSFATLGTDFSSKGNNMTLTNFSLANNESYDWFNDSPSNNYCTLNFVSRTAGTMDLGGLRFYGATAWRRATSTFATTTGKWKYEVTITTAPYSPRGPSTLYNEFGLCNASSFDETGQSFTPISNALMIDDSGYVKNFANAIVDGGVAFVNGDVLRLEWDMDASTWQLYRNNTFVIGGTLPAGLTLTPFVTSYSTSYGLMAFNFGQKPFAHAGTAGYKALCTANLNPSIVLPKRHFDIVVRTGFGAAGGTITGKFFKPEFWWSKSRGDSNPNFIFDALRPGKYLLTNSTAVEANNVNFMNSFNNDGYTMGSADYNVGVNVVEWLWKAGGAAVSNTQGTVESMVSANQAAGFSIATFNSGAAGNQSFGHGLLQTPRFVILKDRDSTTNWILFHTVVCTNVNQYIALNVNGGLNTAAGIWGAALPNSNVVGFGSGVATLANKNVVAYCFHDVEGYQKIGSLSGNAAVDGTFVYCGFRPAYVLIKRSDTATDCWIWDVARNTFNRMNGIIYANLPNAEFNDGATFGMDALSNGFKMRTSNSTVNGGTLTFLAIAEQTMKYANGR